MRLEFIVAGSIDQRTGGYLYDARIVAGLRRLGWAVSVHELEGSFPMAGAAARAALAGTLDLLPLGSLIVMDGLVPGSLPELVAVAAARHTVIDLVHHPLTDETGLDPDWARRLEAQERQALSLCAGAIVTSRFTARRVVEFGVPEDRVEVVLPGTDPAPPAVGPGAGQDPVLLCVGTVSPRKGQDVLVRALARMRHLRWECLLAGSLDREAEYARAIIDQVERAGLSHRVRFLGELGTEALDRVYHGASIFVLPSYYEGYGMALSEALARGLPVLSTTGGAIPHTVPPEVGVLVPPGDDEALESALRGLLDDVHGGGTLRARLRDEALRHAAALPDWQDAARAFASAIRHLTGRSALLRPERSTDPDSPDPESPPRTLIPQT